MGIRADNPDATQIASYWSKWSHIWDGVLTIVRLHTKYRREAVSVLGLKKGQSVLDVACGTGLNFPFLHKEVGPEGRIVAIDIAPGMIQRARDRIRDRGYENVELLLGDVSEAAIPTVDAVTACWCMISIPDYRRALENVLAGLRPGGTVSLLDFKLIDGPPGEVFNPVFQAICRRTHQDVTRQPWLDLRRLLGAIEMREWRFGGLLSSIYLGYGRKT